MEFDISSFLTAGGTAAGVGALGFWIVSKYIRDIQEIPILRNRISNLEIQSTQINETKLAVVRVEEQIKHLAEEVRELKDLLMRKLFND